MSSFMHKGRLLVKFEIAVFIKLGITKFNSTLTFPLINSERDNIFYEIEKSKNFQAIAINDIKWW